MRESSLWSALGDPTRRALLDLLLVEPAPVRVLARAFQITQPAVSNRSQNLIRSKVARFRYFPSRTFEYGVRREPRIPTPSGQITPAAPPYIKDALIRPSFRRTFS